MFQGQYLFKDTAVFSPWFERRGDNIRVTAELVAQNSSNLDVELYHKNLDVVGAGSPVDANKITITSPGRAVQEWNGLKELVRYRMKGTSATAGNFILFRMLDVVWFDTVDASI